MSNSRVESKTAVKNSIGRLAFCALAILLEVVFVAMLFTKLNRYASWIQSCTYLVGGLLVLAIYAQHKTSSMKTPWIILILIFPVLGVLLYFLVGLNGGTWAMRKRYEEIDGKLYPVLTEGETGRHAQAAMLALEKQDVQLANVSAYLLRNSRYPVYQNTELRYFCAEEGLEAQKQALRQAKHFIFMEYHAIEDAEAWHGIQEILEERARAGVEIRVFYDDMGSIGFINKDFVKRMEKLGMQCRIFNPLMPGINLFLNNRDHRKITVVDGIVGFTGGYNLANEYFNLTHPYGQWKDTGIELCGEAVRSLTVTFLENWHAVKLKEDAQHTEPNIAAYLPEFSPKPELHGFIQPYADSPLDDEQVGEEVYISLLNKATKYCWFITPYLILTDEMIHAMGLAAKRGVDVRVVTPGIPDKKMVYQVTRSYYSSLTRNGVRVYEWTPGFCHCKMCVMDDKAATCGTINLDYRSLYHHFENGCLYIDHPAVLETKQDFERTFLQCREVTEEYTTGRGRILRLGQMFLRLFAPLL